jgi:uncharacterized protein (DUF1697 family)
VPVWVSLLRGINLGARNKVNMPRLREALTEAGFAEVQTLVQSGNVVARSRHRSGDAVAAAVRGVVRDTFDLDVPVIVRTPAQLRAVLDWNPFPEQAASEPKLVHVVHLPKAPPASAVRELLGADVAPDAVAAKGREVVLCYAQSMHASKLPRSKLVSRLTADGTARNWRTLTALVDLTRG